jgi:hypothetical protein
MRTNQTSLQADPRKGSSATAATTRSPPRREPLTRERRGLLGARFTATPRRTLQQSPYSPYAILRTRSALCPPKASNRPGHETRRQSARAAAAVFFAAFCADSRIGKVREIGRSVWALGMDTISVRACQRKKDSGIRPRISRLHASIPTLSIRACVSSRTRLASSRLPPKSINGRWAPKSMPSDQITPRVPARQRRSCLGRRRSTRRQCPRSWGAGARIRGRSTGRRAVGGRGCRRARRR